MKTLLNLNLKSPAKINEQMRSLILVLGLDDQQALPLPLAAPAGFMPAARQCHWNTWQQMSLRGGGIQPGWMLFQDPVASVAEAIFHSVWISPDGQLRDITPREDQEEFVQFIADPNRAITLSSHGDRPAIFTFTNARLHGMTVVSQPRRFKAVLMDGYTESIGLWPWPGT
ncbi:hypothetical protein [Xanthomonas cucurbitae]|uniref:Uncharacterized protein n=1 Tax=Xanthomonas cucurbitae TaxID=56453 RepID=A0ABY7YFT6_9XANT|nr:hypothetical protein [Xanthomonas cucurbitae]WDM68880.1 hypothetical protein K6981_06335 [Xanthomonas cucurbitae]WDM72753.1 hypothetical protein K6978_06320 [Xanthomonas cucurbitae]